MNLKGGEFASFFECPENVVFCAYRNFGFLCFDSTNNSLTLITPTQKIGTSTETLFIKVSKIEIKSRSPVTENVTQVLPNWNGSIVALVSDQMVGIVKMPWDFWSTSRLFEIGTGITDIYQKIYEAECFIVHASLFISRIALYSLKVAWFLNETILVPLIHKDDTIHPNMLLGVLYSNNIFRIYNVANTVDCPLFTLDFHCILHKNPSLNLPPSTTSAETRDINKFEMATKMMSFDFGPTYIRKKSNNDDDQYEMGTILLMDLDGQIYVSSMDFRLVKIYDPYGPISVFRNDFISGKFLCVASDLLFIKHKYSSMLPVIAMSSAEGYILHAVMVEVDYADRKASFNTYDFYLHDYFELPCAGKNSSFLCLLDDFSSQASYMSIWKNDAYAVDTSDWVSALFNDVASELVTRNASEPKLHSLSTKTSSRTIFSFIDKESLCEIFGNTSIGNENAKVADNVPGTSQKVTNAAAADLVANDSCVKRNYVRSLACIYIPQLKEPIFDSKSKRVVGTNDCRDIVDQVIMASSRRGDTMISILRHHYYTSATNIFDSKPKNMKNTKEETLFEKVNNIFKTMTHIPKFNFNDLNRLEELQVYDSTFQALIKNMQISDKAMLVASEETSNIVNKFAQAHYRRNKFCERFDNFKLQFEETCARLYNLRAQNIVLENRVGRIADILKRIAFPTKKSELYALEMLKEYEQRFKNLKRDFQVMKVHTIVQKAELVYGSPLFKSIGDDKKCLIADTEEDMIELKDAVKKLESALL